MKPGERQLWRVLNASAITYLKWEWKRQREPPRPLIDLVNGNCGPRRLVTPSGADLFNG